MSNPVFKSASQRSQTIKVVLEVVQGNKWYKEEFRVGLPTIKWAKRIASWLAGGTKIITGTG